MRRSPGFALSALSAGSSGLDQLVTDADDVDQEQPERPLPGPQDLIRRYRRELAPVIVALALLGIAQWGHADHPAEWPLAALIGIVATTTWWRCRCLRPPVPAYVLTVGGFVTLWLVAAWVLGPGHRWLLLALLDATLLAAVPWWDHQLPRPGLEAEDDGASPELRQKVADLVRHWPQLAAAQGLVGVRLQPPLKVDRHGWQWRLRLPTLSKLTARHVIEAAPRLDKVFRVPIGATRLEADAGRADRLLLRVNVSNPLGEPMPYRPPEEMRTFAQPLVPGLFEDRTQVRILLADRHGLGVGRSGSGKSTLQEVLLYELLACRDVVVWAVDLGKRGLHFRDLEPALGWLAQEEAEARAMFAALPEIQDARARWMGEAGHKRWPLSATSPQLVVVVDEYVDLMAVEGCDELAEQVARKGREQGISLFAWSQRGTRDGLGGSLFVKRQAELRIGLGMDAEEVDFVLGRGAHAAGFHPEHFSDQGMFYVRTPDFRVPRPARGFLPADDQGRRIAARWEPYRAQLEPAAAEIVERLRPAPGERALPAAAVKAATEAERRLLELVDAAPTGGITPAELEAAMADLAVKRTWIIAKLPQLEKQGRVCKVTRGRWVGAEVRP